MKTICLFICTLLFNQEARADELTSIVIPGWDKIELAQDHLRFTHKSLKEVTIHLQIDTHDTDNKWNTNTLEVDIHKMAAQRKLMSGFMGINDYKIDNYKYNKSKKIPILELEGSYVRLKNQFVRFKEINFYYRSNFLQLKIISEGSLLSSSEVDQIIKNINPDNLSIN